MVLSRAVSDFEICERASDGTGATLQSIPNQRKLFARPRFAGSEGGLLLEIGLFLKAMGCINDASDANTRQLRGASGALQPFLNLHEPQRSQRSGLVDGEFSKFRQWRLLPVSSNP